MKKIVAVLFGISLLIGCASTHVTGFRDPAYSDKSYSKPAVVVRIDDLDHRLLLEEFLVEEFAVYGVSAVKGSEIYPPTRAYSTEEWTKAFMMSAADSAVIVTLKGGSVQRQTWMLHLLAKDVGAVVWTGESKSELLQENVIEGKNIETMFRSIAQNVAGKMAEDGVVKSSGQAALTTR